MSIVIDSVTYDVPIISISRKADTIYKYAERVESGDLKSEVLGVFYNYDLTMGMSSNNIVDYAALWVKLTEPTESHTVTILGDTYSAYFAGVKDEVSKDKGTPYFRNLSFAVIAISPARTP